MYYVVNATLNSDFDYQFRTHNKQEVLFFIEHYPLKYVSVLQIFPHKGKQTPTMRFCSARSDIGKLILKKGFYRSVKGTQ